MGLMNLNGSNLKDNFSTFYQKFMYLHNLISSPGKTEY